MVWKKIKSKLSNEDLWSDKYLGNISIIEDFNGSYSDFIVESNNKEFTKKYGDVGVPFTNRKDALKFAKWWMKKLSEG